MTKIETITINSIAYLSAGDESPWQYKSAFGVEDLSHDPYVGDDLAALVEQISDSFESAGGPRIEKYWVRDDCLYVKTEDVCNKERAEEEEAERLARELAEEEY